MLTPNSDQRSAAAVLFLDLQEEIVKNSRTNPLDLLRLHAGALAKLAGLHRLPAFASSVPPGGSFLPEVLGPLPEMLPRPRHFTTAFADLELTAAIAATGRPVLILAGVASEIVVVRTALDALAAGYRVALAVDACGGISARTEDAALRRFVAAGGTTTSVATFGAELTGDFTTELGAKTLGLIYEILGS